MTKFKVLSVIGDAKSRDIGQIVQGKLDEFVKENPKAEVENVSVNTDFQAGGYGKAFVILTYKEANNGGE